MMRGMRRVTFAIAALAPVLALALPALADGPLTSSSGALVRGGAPLPRFTPGFPIDIAPPSPNLGPREDLEISLTSPDRSVLHFLFSPRAVSGETVGFGSTVTGSYAGLAWNIFESDSLFGGVALTGAVNRQALDDPTQRLYGPLMSLHSTIELGYSFNAQQSLSLALDHGSPAPYYGNDLRLRYGYHF
jgi:hypothetical protein